MYGDWSCHCTVKKINEVFPMIDKNLEQDLTFQIFFFSVLKLALGTLVLVRLFSNNGYFPPNFPMICPMEDHILHLRRNQTPGVHLVWCKSKPRN